MLVSLQCVEVSVEVDDGFEASLKEVNNKLHLTHETLQDNIGRMTGILAQLNIGASEFADALDGHGDSYDLDTLA